MTSEKCGPSCTHESHAVTAPDEVDELLAKLTTAIRERDEARGAALGAVMVERERAARLVEEMMAPLFEREHIAAAIRSAPTEQAKAPSPPAIVYMNPRTFSEAKPVCDNCGGRGKVLEDHDGRAGYSRCPRCSGGAS